MGEVRKLTSSSSYILNDASGYFYIEKEIMASLKMSMFSKHAISD